MRKALRVLASAIALVLVMTGSALANEPAADPLPVNGQPDCFGARVSHSASDHGLTPKAKIAKVDGMRAFLGGLSQDDLIDLGWDVWVPAYLLYFDENGVSVRTIQNWIRINCSDDPIVPNP